MNTQQLLGAGALLSAAMIFSPLALAAGDTATFHGAICDASVGSYSSKISKSVAGTQNSTNTAGVSVTCPLTRDNPLSASGTYGAKVAVYRSASATINLQCTLSSRDPKGVFVASQTLSFGGIGDATLNFNAINSVVGGYYVVSCYLPQYSAVRGIYIDEK
ncbi:MAG: hypothetical protein ACU837_14980 [Gammaproteobacteria bacterium]